MATKLDYAKSATRAGRSVREMLVDALAGSCLILGGLFSILFLVFVTGNVAASSDLDGVFEKPSRRVRRGLVRLTRGKDAARSYQS